MKAITLTQPWASLVALGEKRIETRSWRTGHRGVLAIHAAKGFPKQARRLCSDPVFFAGALRQQTAAQLPTGAILAVAELKTCRTTESQVDEWWQFHNGLNDIGVSKEMAFGDYTLRRHAWILVNVRRFETPIPCVGALGLWTVPEDVVQAMAGEPSVVVG